MTDSSPMPAASAIHQATPAEYPLLARALGDSPATVIPLHQLHTHQATAWYSGPPAAPHALVIQANPEPTAFGNDAAAVYAILQQLPHWFCVECAAELAKDLQNHLMAAGRPSVLYADIYYTLRGPLGTLPPPVLPVRLLTSDDLPVWLDAPPEFHNLGFATPQAVLEQGWAAGAFAGGKLVALAHTSALSPTYADVGVYTDPVWRGRKLATAVAELVMEQVCVQGRTPLWSTGEDNHASRRIAHKLGLEECLRRTYVIPTPP